MKKLLTMLLLLPTLLFAGRIVELNSNNSISFNQAFDDMYVAKKQLEAINLCNSNGGKDIYITLYTPGGSISAGQLFFDTLNALPCKFHTITIFSASMRYQTVQNLGQRLIMESSTLMSHRASIGGLGGELGGELDSILELLNQNVKEMEIVASNRVGISLEKYRESIRDELWLTGKKAVETNHADEIVTVKCDNSLLTTRVDKVQTFFGPLNVTFSNCPIIVAPLSFEGSNDSESIAKYLKDFLNIKNRVKFTL